MSVFERGSVKFKNIEIAQGGVRIGFGGSMPMPPTTDYFVDGTLGNSGNSGLGWGTGVALKTIDQAFTKADALATRGRFRIFVAPAGYTEDPNTPLNANAPFGQLIAVNPTPGNTFGAAWWTGSNAGEACLTVRARGWYIAGFEFDALADAECIVIGGGDTGTNGAGLMLEDNLFVGQNQGLAGVDWQSGVAGNPHVTIRNNGFYGFTSGSTAGKCLSCTVSGIDQPRFALIEHNWFGDSDNLIDMNPRGFKESIIRYNSFYTNGANQNPDEIIDNTGGNDTQVYGNKFPEPYTTAGGYVAGTNDNWAGNMAEDVAGEAANGWTYADPATA